jgi:glyoxylase-like metal-dependent hydrolase (beta-lactamase superfamily II)
VNAAEQQAAPSSRPARPFEVHAVRYATLAARKSELFYRYGAYGEPDADVEMSYYFWVLRREGETILIDTGFDPPVGARRGRTCLCAPLEALARLGVEPSSVSTVIVTHFHYDHTGNLDAFPGAELVVPRRELEFWTSPIAARLQFASHVEPKEIAYLQEAAAEGRVRVTEGREELLDGVTAIAVGGHSAGQQLTIVSSGGGDIVLASDAVHFYEELELERPFAVVHDLERMYAAYEVLRGLASDGATVIPGHDPEVARRYATAAVESDGISVLIA